MSDLSILAAARNPARRLENRIASCAHAVANLVEDSRKTSTERERYESLHPELASPSATRSSGAFVFAAWLLAVYVIDLVLFRAAASDFARRAFGDAPYLLEPAIALIPLALIGLESYVAFAAYEAWSRRGQPGAIPDVIKWTLTGLLLASVTPALVWSTHLATTYGTEDAGLERIAAVSGLALVALAAVAHFSVLLSGRLASDARTHIAYALHQRKSRRQERRFEARYRRQALGLSHAVREYRGLTGGSGIPPFDLTTRRVVRGLFGEDLPGQPGGLPADTPVAQPVANPAPATPLPNPTAPVSALPSQTASAPLLVTPPNTGGHNGNAAPSSQAAPSVSPQESPAAPQAPADGELAYLRSLLEYRQREPERELLPWA
jgi:hypothetical protein